jgi:hypothetical protein
VTTLLDFLPSLLNFLPSPAHLCSCLIIQKDKNMIKSGASSGFFKQANNVTITGGTFNEVHGDVCPVCSLFFPCCLLNSPFIASHP